MFELIGIVVVCLILFVVVKGIFKASSTVRSQEYGKESSRIAIVSMNVPESYYSHKIMNNMESIKSSAQILPTHDVKFKDSSWPRLIALIVYGEWHQDCQQWQMGNPIQQQLFIDLRISNDTVSEELVRNPTDVLYANA